MNELGKNIFVETHYAGVNVGAILTYKGLIAVDVPTFPREARDWACLLYTSDAADERSSVDLGGRRIIKNKHTDTVYSRLLYSPDNRKIPTVR